MEWLTTATFILFIEVFVLFGLVRVKWPLLGIVSVAVTIALLDWIAGADPITWVTNNWSKVLIGLVVYVGVGVGYSVYQWYRAVRQWERACVAAHESGDQREFDRHKRSKPQLSQSDDMITQWIAFWPIDALWHFCGEFLERILEFFSWIYRSARYLYGGISERSQKRVDDLPPIDSDR